MVFSVGIDYYPSQSGFHPLRFAKRDSQNFINGLFTSNRTNINLTYKVKRNEFLTSFAKWVSSLKEDVGYFYFAGHGFVSPTGTNLVFSDSHNNSILSTSVEIYQLLELVWNSSKNFLFILDCCLEKKNDVSKIDFTPPNVTIVYTSEFGSKRYEKPALLKSFPAKFATQLSKMSDNFHVKDLLSQINKGESSKSQYLNSNFWASSNLNLKKSDFNINHEWFKLDDNLTSIELISSLNPEYRPNIISPIKRLNYILQERYFCSFKLVDLDVHAKGLFALEITCNRLYLELIINDIVGIMPKIFNAISFISKLKIDNLIKAETITLLPGSDKYVKNIMWNLKQFKIEELNGKIIVKPIKGDVCLHIDENSGIGDLCIKTKLL